VNGSNRRSRSGIGTPGPSSSTLMVVRLPARSTVSATLECA
jgi:hypothetical protein